MHIASIGIDLGKTTFHLVALGEQNKVLLRKKFSRPQLLAYTGKLPAALIGLEACIGAHFVGTALREQGHEVRLSPAQFVKPYRKSNKNDLREWAAVRSNEFHHNYRISSKRGHFQPPPATYSFAYSALASFRMGMSWSASFHSFRKSWYAARALTVSRCNT
jgi:hypothetical protein